MTTALLFSGLLTDQRVWAPVVERLSLAGVGAEVVAYSTRLPADPIAVAEGVLTAGTTYDVVVAPDSAAASAVHVARKGGARAVVLIGPSGGLELMGEVDGDLDENPFVDELIASSALAGEALLAGDRAEFARLMADGVVAVIGPAHRAVIEAMAMDGAESMMKPPKYIPWQAWLPQLTVPVVMLFGERASRAGSYGRREADVLMSRCRVGHRVSVAFEFAEYTGLTHPTELADITARAVQLADNVDVPSETDSGKTDANDASKASASESGTTAAPKIGIAVDILNAYLSERHDDERAMAAARQVASKHESGEVIDNLIALSTMLLAFRAGESGLSAKDSLVQAAQIAQSIQDWADEQ